MVGISAWPASNADRCVDCFITALVVNKWLNHAQLSVYDAQLVKRIVVSGLISAHFFNMKYTYMPHANSVRVYLCTIPLFICFW